MKTTTNYPDFEVVELTNEDAAEALSDFSGLELVPTEEERMRKALAPRPLHVVPIGEQMRIAHESDAWAKVRRDVDRCHWADVDAGARR